MAEMTGADPRELDALASWCEMQSRSLSTSTAMLHSLLHTAPWEGPSADEFRARWNQSYRGWLIAVTAYLDDAARILRTNATQQTLASAANPSRPPLATPARVIPSVPGTAASLSADFRKYGWAAAPFVSLLTKVPVMKKYLDFAAQADNYFRLGQDIEQHKLPQGLDQLDQMVSGDFVAKAISSKSPLLFLVGANVIIWGDDVKAAGDINWSYTVHHLSDLNPLNVQNLEIYGATGKQAAITVFKQLVGSL